MKGGMSHLAAIADSLGFGAGVDVVAAGTAGAESAVNEPEAAGHDRRPPGRQSSALAAPVAPSNVRALYQSTQRHGRSPARLSADGAVRFVR